MLYDVFISHAGEDKDSVVRPLAHGLRDRRIEVWYDEFALTAGMSLRRSIDFGLAKSRFGIVVLSPSFFGKGWPEWELNGLVQRHVTGTQTVLLPIWHHVSREVVAGYSPSLADLVALNSNLGVDALVQRLCDVIQPQESALVSARNYILRRGYEPPVISDDWWLDAIEGAGWQDHNRWHFPVWKMTSESAARGEALAWTVMQHVWQQAAEELFITQITPPERVVEFVLGQPGLREVSEEFPDRMLEFAPQLAIPGFGGPLEPMIESAFRKSVLDHQARRSQNDMGGSALTTNGLCPACEDCFALRHPTFGDYEPSMVACGYAIGNGAGLGPHTSAFPIVDYLVWFLSPNSGWLPPQHHAFLLQGFKDWAQWAWFGESSDSDFTSVHAGKLHTWLTDERRRIGDELSQEALADLWDRIDHSRRLVSLAATTEELVKRFLAERFIEAFLNAPERRRRRKSRRQKSRSSARN